MISVQFDGIEQVVSALEQYVKDQRERAKLACAEVAHLLENYAIREHPWTVRTGWTTHTTHGVWQAITEDIYEIVISAGMTYDIFLEHEAAQYQKLIGIGGVKQTEWSWLWPALMANRDEIMRIFQKHLSR